MGRRKGKSVRKNKRVGVENEEEDLSRAPHSFVVHRGKTGKFVQELANDFRRVMEPYTATNIKVRPKNVIKDFVHVAGLLKVSHLAMFTKTSLGPYLKLARFPRGPTLTFRIEDYTLGRDVRASLKRQVTYAKQFANHALLIMNSFNNVEGDRSLQLVESMFQNMFPSINPTKVKVNSIRRCVLLNYNKDTKMIDFRHYTIKVVPTGLNKGVKKLVTARVPDLGRMQDMGEFMEKGGGVSESEGEEEDSKVTLPHFVFTCIYLLLKVTLPQGVAGRGAVGGEQSSVRLVELGPRMKLQLVKIEEGLLEGEVLHHSFLEKTEEEKKEIKERMAKRKKEKEQRKRQQDLNVRKKEKEKELNKSRSLEGMKKKEESEKSWQGEKIAEFVKEQKAKGEEVEDFDTKEPEASSDDDDERWYEEEVGEKPDREVFSNSGKRGGGSSRPFTGGKTFSKRGRRGGGAGREERDGGRRGGGGGRGRGDGRESKEQRREKKGKRPKKVFNSEGVGPNYKKGSSQGRGGGLRGVRGGKVSKRGRR